MAQIVLVTWKTKLVYLNIALKKIYKPVGKKKCGQEV